METSTGQIGVRGRNIRGEAGGCVENRPCLLLLGLSLLCEEDEWIVWKLDGRFRAQPSACCVVAGEGLSVAQKNSVRLRLSQAVGMGTATIGHNTVLLLRFDRLGTAHGTKTLRS